VLRGALDAADQVVPLFMLDDGVRRRLDYPEPIVDLDEGLARFRRARGD
jgi:hypothetical protein